MLMKLITLGVVILAVLSVANRFRAGAKGGRRTLSAARCKSCGRPRIGKGPCDCGGKG